MSTESNDIGELFAARCLPRLAHNDIVEHMDTLRRYASEVISVCEIGVRTGNSTTALLAGLSANGGMMDSYDIEEQIFFPPVVPSVRWQFHLADSQHERFTVPSCDLLFIDGCHKYGAVKTDLRQAAHVSRYVILHDTDQARDEKYNDGVCRAMDEFLSAHPEWRIKERFHNCNGLTVLERA